MILLAVVWILLIMPPGETDPEKQYEIGTVYFSSAEDCNTAGTKWIDELTDSSFADERHRRFALKWGDRRTPNPARDGAKATFSCVEKDQ
jgi:hypothetical protein